MPKPFPIVLNVEEIAVGKVMRKLNQMEGVISVHMEMSPTDKPKANGTGKRGEQTGLELLATTLLNAGRPVGREDIRAAFKADGRSEKSVENQIFHARKLGWLNTPGYGLYTLSAKGKAAIQKAEKAEAA